MERDIKNKVKNRAKCNKALIEVLQAISEEYPDLRFHQILYAFDFVDPEKGDLFSEEPEDTLGRVIASIYRQLLNEHNSKEVKMFLKKIIHLDSIENI